MSSLSSASLADQPPQSSPNPANEEGVVAIANVEKITHERTNTTVASEATTVIKDEIDEDKNISLHQTSPRNDVGANNPELPADIITHHHMALSAAKRTMNEEKPLDKDNTSNKQSHEGTLLNATNHAHKEVIMDEDQDETTLFLKQAIAAANDAAVKRSRGIRIPFNEHSSATSSVPDMNQSSAQGQPSGQRVLGQNMMVITGFEATPKWKRKTFDTRFRELQEFKAINDHCDVPTGYAIDPSLGQWCRTQRKAYKDVQTGFKKMVPERKRQFGLLEELGFHWSLKPTKRRKTSG